MKIKLVNLAMLALALLSFNLASASTADSTANVEKQKESIEVYHRALKYNDLGTAATALTHFLHAGGDPIYQDSLAIIFYNLNNMSGAYKLANELYTLNNKNETALTLLADISGRGGETKISLEWYEKLCALNPSPFNYYQLGSKQFVLERKLECRQSLQKVLADSAQAVKQLVSLEVNNGYFEQVPVLAASYNMLAVLAFQDKKTAEAEALYKKAIEIAPNFVIAKQNLEGMKTKSASKSATKTGPSAKSKE
jgi:tetratricopeptide (TPR) repeat protein